MSDQLIDFIQYYKNRLTADEYMDICFWHDQTRDKVHDFYFKKDKIFYSDMEANIQKFNEHDVWAAGYMLNPLKEPKRLADNVSRIIHVAIDIDKGNDESKYETVKAKLTEIGIKTVLEDKSQNGFHFVIPVDMDRKDNKYVERFLKGFKEYVHSDVDTIVFDLPRFFRLPDTFNNKGEEPYKLQTIYFGEVSDEDIEKNTRIITNYAKDVKLKSDLFERIVSDKPANQEEPDVFFSKLLKDKKLRQYIAEADGIEKNNILFKNLAIYTKTHSNIENDAYDFVKQCEHSEGEFYGWIKKEMLIVNYEELRRWIFDYDLKPLMPIIKEQLKQSTKFLNNFQICYMTSQKTHRYMIFDKTTGSCNQHTESQMAEFVKYLANSKGIDLYSELDIYMYDQEGKPLSQKQLVNRIIEKLLKMFEESDILQIVEGFGYKPTNEIFFEEFGKKFFNTYTPGPLENYYEEKDEYKFPLVEQLIRHLCGSEVGYNYFNKWLGFILQNPLTKLPSSIIFKGTQGTGKGRMREWILPYIFGDHNIEEINDTNLKNIWGDYIKNNRIVVANEINLTDSSSNAAYKRIKEYSTDKEVSIQQKGKPLEKIKNYSHWLFFSDQEMPVRLEAEDRRHTIFHQHMSINPKIVMSLSPDINPGILEAEMKEYVSYLRSLKVEFEDVYTFLPTDEKDEIIHLSKDTVEAFMEEVNEYKDLAEFSIDHNSDVHLDPDLDLKAVISTNDLYALYIAWCQRNHFRYHKAKIGFGMILSKKFDLNSERGYVGSKRQRLYKVKDFKWEETKNSKSPQ